MGLFQNINRFVSGADFWDKKENAQQREQFKKEDEEKEKARVRRQQQEQVARQVSRGNNPSTPVNQPQVQQQPAATQTFDFSSPLEKVGSQSDFKQPNPLQPFGVEAPEKALPVIQKNAQVAQPLPDVDFKGITEGEKQPKKLFGKDVSGVLGDRYGYTRSVTADRNVKTNKDKYVASFDKLSEEYQDTLVKQAKAQAEQGDQAAINTLRVLQDSGRLNKDLGDLLQRGADFASVPGLSVGRVGTGVAQGVSGLYDLASPGEGTSQVSKVLDKTAQSIDIQADKQDVTGAYKTANVGTELASYLIPSTLATKVASKLSKTSKITTDAVEAVARTLAPEDANKIRQVMADGLRKGLTPEEILTEVGITNKYVGENASKGNDTSLSSVAGDLALGVGGNAALRVVGEGVQQLNRLRNVDEGLEKIDDGLRKVATKSEDAMEVSGASKLDEAGSTPGVQIDDGIKSTNIPKVAEQTPPPAPIVPEAPLQQALPLEEPQLPPNVPGADYPIALAKADELSVSEPLPMADFRESVNGSLEKVDAPVEQVVQPAPEVDVNGNQVITSDAVRQRELLEQGIVQDVPSSIAGGGEVQMAEAAERALQEQVIMPDNAAAPNVQDLVRDTIDSQDLLDDIAENFPTKEPLNIEQTKQQATANLNQLDELSLIQKYEAPKAINSPLEYFEAVEATRRLGKTTSSPEALTAARNAYDTLAEYPSKAGQALRVTRTLFEEMSPIMKENYLLNKTIGDSSKAGDFFNDTDRAQLLQMVEQADEVLSNYREINLQAETITDLFRENGAQLDTRKLSQVSDELDRLEAQKVELENLKMEKNADVIDFYKSKLPKGSVGKAIGNLGRASMLASLTGRAFDVLSTSATLTDDVATDAVSGLIGKAVNKISGAPGKVVDSLPKLSKYAEGAKDGFNRFRKQFGGQGYVDSLDDTFKNPRTRSDLENPELFKGTTQKIKALTELPTQLTSGRTDDRLFALATQEAQQLGLPAEQAGLYARARSIAPTQQMLDTAKQAQLKTNMLHRNKISKFLYENGQKIEELGGAKGAIGTIMKNNIAPFTSWLGGNLNRTLTDKNVGYNAYKIVDSLLKGETQEAVDQIAKATVNVAEAYAIGYKLTEMGIITDTDANGNNYDGLYINIGDRYAPVAILGTASVPLILGNTAHKGLHSEGDLPDNISSAIASGFGNVMANAGVASTLGGQNNAQQLVNDTIQEIRKDPEDRTLDPITKAATNAVSQYIPSGTNDVNALLNQVDMLNPTGEAADTKVTSVNPATGRDKTNVAATQLNRLKNRIPILSQTLPRKEGELADDILDRVTKGNREGEAKAAERAAEESLDDIKRRLDKEGVPTSKEALTALFEDGDYEKAIKGHEYRLAEAEADPNTAESTKQKIRDDLAEAELGAEGVSVNNDGIEARAENGDYEEAIRGLEYQLDVAERDADKSKSYKAAIKEKIDRLNITKEGDYPPEAIELYSSISLTEWRDMGDPDSEDYDQERYDLLYAYDQAMAEGGVSRKGDGTKFKYYAKGYNSRGKSTGGSGGGGSAGSFSTDIAKQTFSPSFTPIKEQAATFAAQGSAIPQLEKVKSYDTSKLKKISVSRGRQA